MIKYITMLIVLSGIFGLAQGASTVDVLTFDSEQQQRRYKALIDEFRCPKCLNTNLAGSDAPIAQDLRKVVYRLVVTQGMSDQEVRDYLQARYGDFVLYDPPFNSKTWYIWLVPIALGVLALFVLLRLVRGARSSATVLNAQQQERLQEIVGNTAGSSDR